jgi:hypothetical protein
MPYALHMRSGERVRRIAKADGRITSNDRDRSNRRRPKAGPKQQ